jgi:hypothetical protein
MQGNGAVAGLPLAGAAFIAVFFVAMWCLVSYVSSWLCGWQRLAEQFRFDGQFDGEQWRFCTGWMRWRARYGGVLVLGANQRGLYMRTLWPLRLGHPPLLIPWSDVSAVDRTRWFWEGTQFTLGREAQIPLWVYKRVGDRILAHRPSADDVVKEFYSRPGAG